MAERFYTNCHLQPGRFVLEGPEARHLAAVRRFRPGDAVCLFNGDGHEYAARIEKIERRQVILEVVDVSSPQRELPLALEVAAPLPKADRAQFLVEKLTELGVASFVPLVSARSVVQPRETRLEKLRRYVVEASKQCGRNVLMSVEPMTEWPDYCRRTGSVGPKVFAHPGAHREDAQPLPDDARSVRGAHLCLAVGPEGGFTEEEVVLALAAGWRCVDLGPRILRVETAALTLVVAYSWCRIDHRSGKSG